MADSSTLWMETQSGYVHQLRKCLKSTGEALGYMYKVLNYQEYIQHRNALKKAWKLLKSQKSEDISEARKIINEVDKSLGFFGVTGHD